MALPCSSAGGEGVWGERLVFCQTETPTLPAGNWGGRSRECRTHNVRLLPPLLGSLLCSGQPRSPERQRSRCREQVQCDGSPPWPALPLPCSPPPTTTATPPQPHSLTRPAQPLLGCMARVPGTCGCTHTTLASVLLSLFEPHSNPGSPWHCTPGSAPSLLLRTAEIRRVPIRVGSCTAFTSIQLEPSPSHLPRTPCPPHPPQSHQAVQHPGTFPLAPVPGLGEHWPQALGACWEADNRQQLPWWQATVSSLTLQTLGKDIFIALPWPMTHKFFGAGARAGE